MNSRAHADGDAVRTHAMQKCLWTVLSKFFMLPSGFKSDLCAFPPPTPVLKSLLFQKILPITYLPYITI